MTIYFDYLGEAYVFKGTLEYTRTFNPVQHFVQNLGLDTRFVGDVALPYPESFQAEWMTLRPYFKQLPSTSGLQNWDSTSYGIGAKPDVTATVVPIVKKVHLFYLVNTGVSTARTLLEYHGNDANFIDQLKTVRFNDLGSYAMFCNLRGYNQYGGGLNIYPENMSPSNVDNLSSVRATFLSADGEWSGEQAKSVMVEPMHIRNGRPVFDWFFMIADDNRNPAVQEGLLPGRLLRWQGGELSEYRMPINWELGTGDPSEGATVIPIGQTILGEDRPLVPVNPTHDGIETNPDPAYNLTKTPR